MKINKSFVQNSVFCFMFYHMFSSTYGGYHSCDITQSTLTQRDVIIKRYVVYGFLLALHEKNPPKIMQPKSVEI